ncbi:flagellar protein FlgN [bacterium]|nr:flagellar protein FlgN [bacterium]
MTSSRADSLNQLIELMRQELALVRDELQPAMKAKRESLVQNQLDGLQSLAEREQALAGQLTALEAQRILAVGEVCRAHAINSEEGQRLSLIELLDLLPDGEPYTVLAGLARELQPALIELAWINADNSHLARNLLDYTAMILNVVTHGETKPRYGADGRYQKSAQDRAMLDNRI